MKHLIIPFLPFGLAITLVACDENWGDSLEAFARYDARPLSLEHAKADLRDRWAAAHRAQSLSVLTNTHLLSEKLAGISLIEAKETSNQSELTKDLIQTEANLSELLAMQFQADQLLESRKTWQLACESRTLFEATGLSQISLPEISYGSLPKPNYQFSVNSNPVQCVFDLGKSLFSSFTAKSVDEQNDKARNAVALAHQLTIQGDELFALSKLICLEEAQEFASTMNQAEETGSHFASALAQYREALQKYRNLIEAKLAPLELLSFMKSDGTLAFLANLQTQREQADRSINLQQIRGAISKAKKEILRTKSCEKRLSALEDLEEQLVAALAQIEFELKQISDEAPIKKELLKVQGEFNASLEDTQKKINEFSPNQAGDCQ